MTVEGQRGVAIKSFTGLLIILALSFGCAEVQPPSGGPPDKTPPVIDSTFPLNGSVNVPEGNRIDVFFSEDIQSSQGRAVFISPHPTKAPDLHWGSDHLTIILPQPFQTGQTYVVTVNPSITDLHGNKLDSSMTFAFSTGATLDSGRISGHVFQNGTPLSGTLVGLYADANLSDSLLYDSLYAAYLTATGTNGYFSFQYLPSQTYRMIAFTDRNRDDRFNPLREAFGVPDRPVAIGGPLLLDSLVLNMTAIDTTRPEIVSVTYSANALIRARLSKDLPFDYLKDHLSTIRLWPGTDSTNAIAARAIGESDLTKSATLTIYFGPLAPGVYTLELQPIDKTPPLRFANIQVREGKDTEPPAIVRHTPAEKPMFVSDVRIGLTFSEPIDTTKLTPQTFSLNLDTTTLVPAKVIWKDAFQAAVLPDTLLAGAKYRLNITEFEIFDLAGNPLGDSLQSFAFSTLNADSLGTMSGTVDITLPDKAKDPVVLILRETRNRFTDTLNMSNREFRVDVPAGKYILSGFIDSDKDGKHFDGSVWPYRYAETSAILADTVAVRARFETSDVHLTFK